MPSCGVPPSVCLSVRLSRSCILSKRIKISSIFFSIARHAILVFTYKTLCHYSDRDPLTGALNAGGVGNYQPISGSIACCKRFDCQVQYTQLRRGKLLTLIAGKRRCFFLMGDDNVFMTRSLNVTPKTTEQHFIVRSGKYEAEVTIIEDCAVEADYWQTRSIARLLCDSRSACFISVMFYVEAYAYI